VASTDFGFPDDWANYLFPNEKKYSKKIKIVLGIIMEC